MRAGHRITLLTTAAILVLTSAGQAVSAPAKTTARPAARAAGSDTQVRAFNANIMVLNNDFDAQSQAMEARMEAVKLGDAIMGDKLASPENIRAGHAAVAKMRAVLAERAEAERLYHDNSARLLTPQIEKIVGAKSTDMLRKRLAHARSTSALLLAARTNYAAAVEGVLLWAEKQGTDIAVVDGKLALPTDRQIAELQSLYQEVNAAADAEGRIVEAVAPLHRQYQQSLERMQKESQR